MSETVTARVKDSNESVKVTVYEYPAGTLDVTIKDSAGTTLYTLPPGATQAISDSSIKNSAGTEIHSVKAQADQTIADSSIKDSFGTEIHSVKSESAQTIADSKIYDSAGNLLHSVLAEQPQIIADGQAVNSDASFSIATIAEAITPLPNITHIDSDGTPVVYPGMKPFTATPAQALTYASAKLMKTGQTTSYRTGDDGDFEAGREVDFFTLKANNPFGNINRFTDELGGQTYTNNIVIDWSTFDGSIVLGYRRMLNGDLSNWNSAINGALSVSIGNYTSGWRLPNIKELQNLQNWNLNQTLNYAPFNLVLTDALWSSTTPLLGGGAFAMCISANIQTTYILKVNSNNYQWLPCRNFTVTGTTLT